MYNIYTTDTSYSGAPTVTASPISNNINHFQHTRKLSHVQVGKKPYKQESSSSFIIPLDDSNITNTKSLSTDTTTTDIHFQQTKKTDTTIQEIEEITMNEKKTKRARHWLLSAKYNGPFTKGTHWPVFSYLMVAFTIIIFSGELLLSKQSSGEFFELEPFNYMLGPSIEIMIQVGARFPPCMRHVESMPPDERYVCLNTIQQKSTSHNNNNNTIGASLFLFDPVVNLADPRLLNTSCSLSSICGMSSFHEDQVPDQTYRFFTPLVIHTGLIHLIINIFVLIFFGIKVERVTNSLRFSLLFIGSGIFGHALGANFAPPTTPFLGFSSSLFGLIGFLYIDLMANWKNLEQPIRYLIKLLLTTAFSFILGLLPGVDNFSHLGGLISGILLSLFLMPPMRSNTQRKKILVYFFRLSSLFLYGLFLGILIHHFSTSNIDEECPYCRYLSCLPINGFCD